MDRLIFLDLLTGEEIAYEVTGERYTPYLRGVTYYDWRNRQVMLATPEREPRQHPFIELAAAERVDWLVSDDRRAIAWTQTLRDAEGRLSTITHVANIDGSQSRMVLQDGPNSNGVRALPIAFSENNDLLYLDTYPDGIDQFTPFNVYAGVFALELDTGEMTPLPDEQPANCLCGADIVQDLFVRLRWTPELTGFDLWVYDLPGQLANTIPALNLADYTTTGDVIIAPDGRQALYALARLTNAGRPEQTIQTVFVLADLETMTQEAITRPITLFLRPVTWTEDDTAILLTSPTTDGTWKLNLSEGSLTQIARASYLGVIQAG